ncbi:MAG: transposase [Aliivibrio sp.]|nr:transposase [Aliivibrio sp.]
MGFTIVLHTNSRRRDLHPHLHVIVAGGGYDSSKGVWLKGNRDYLFNAFALAKVWRARMLAAIQHHKLLSLPASVPKKWVVDCHKVGYGLPALQY